MAPAHSKPDADPDATAARKRKSGVNAALARGKQRRLEEDGHFTKSSLVVLDGSCDLTIKDIMTSENLTFAEAVEVAQRFRAEAAQASAEHPKAGGSLPSSSPGPKTLAPDIPMPESPAPDPSRPAPKSILKKKVAGDAADLEGEVDSSKVSGCVTFTSQPQKVKVREEEEASQVSKSSSKATSKSPISEEKGAVRGSEREEFQEGRSGKKKKGNGGKAKEENPDPEKPPLVSKPSKKKDKAEEVHESAEASSSSSKRKRKSDMYDEIAQFGHFTDEGVSETEPLCKNLRKLKACENLEEQEMDERRAAWIEWWETWGQYEHECGYEEDWEGWEDWQGCVDAEWEGGDTWWGEQVLEECEQPVPRRLRFKQPEAKPATPLEEYSQDRQPDPLLAFGW